MDMDWAAKWYKEGRDAQADVETYDPVATVVARLAEIKRSWVILELIAANEGHVEHGNVVVRSLRVVHPQLLSSFKRLDESLTLGLDFSMPEVGRKDVAGWRTDDWYDNVAKPALATVATHIGVARRLSQQTKKDARLWNKTTLVLADECARYQWALDPERNVISERRKRRNTPMPLDN